MLDQEPDYYSAHPGGAYNLAFEIAIAGLFVWLGVRFFQIMRRYGSMKRAYPDAADALGLATVNRLKGWAWQPGIVAALLAVVEVMGAISSRSWGAWMLVAPIVVIAGWFGFDPPIPSKEEAAAIYENQHRKAITEDG